jgi:hypothetical protein
VTDEDLANMKTFFANLQNQSSESGSTASNNTGLDATEDDQDFLKSFLDKVAAGTVTDADLTNVQNMLLQMNQQS